MKKLKNPFLFAIACLPVAIIGGYFVLRYQMELLPPETIRQLIETAGSQASLIVVGLTQTSITVMLSAFFGRVLAEKLGLWKHFCFEKKKMQSVVLLSVIAGILFSADYWTFGALFPQIKEATKVGMTFWGVSASVFYGGVIEELLMRLFIMSFIGFILWKLFWRKKENVPTVALIIANVLSTVLFAAGHLPVTLTAFGSLTPMLIFRCFLLNGSFGLLFGWMYRKYGIQYSMVGHSLCHIVSKLIWWIAL